MSKTEAAAVARWQDAVLAYIAGHPDRPLKTRALARHLRVPDTDYIYFRGVVRELLAGGRLVLGPGRTLRLPAASGQIVGVFRANRRGFGFVERPGQPALYIDARRTANALEGDTVAVRLLKRHGPLPGPQAEVVRIVERAPLRWVGIVEVARGEWVVQPHGRTPMPVVTIANPGADDSRPGDLVTIEPDLPSLQTRRPKARLVARLGDPQLAATWIRGVVHRYNLPEAFPPRVRQAAERAARHFDAEQDFSAREDLRDLLTITIDPSDARDFDDAVSIEHLAGGRVRLGVHIADVAHFVQPDGVIDREARRRGNSVYFPGLVLPMLPEALSNRVCSLQPGEPRLTRSVFITYDDAARVVETRFAESVIRSRARLTYEQASAALAGAPQKLAADVLALLRSAESLARLIQRRRRRNGMITLALPEVEIRLDARGRVAAAGPADTSYSHTTIEMFMVEANEAVSRALREAGVPHLRRVHPSPDPVAAEGLAQLGPILGHAPPATLTRESINQLLADVAGRPEQAAVNFVLLRSLAQASYSPAEIGHFALASEDYCHFTSPIRRYPDLTVHRLLGVLRRPAKGRGGKARGRRPAMEEGPSETELVELGVHTSATERKAQQAEREARQQLLLLLLSRQVGETFEAVITGVASFGAFVQLAGPMAEGLVRVQDFGGDDWRFDRLTNTFYGSATGRLVHVGQSLSVTLVRADLARQELSFVPAAGIGKVARTPQRGKKGRPQREMRRGRRARRW